MCQLLEPFQGANDECRRPCLRAVRDVDPKAFRRLGKNDPEWREDFRKAVCCCLQALSETGLGRKEDPEALCVAWVPAPGQRYIAMLTESRHSWAASLEDSRDYFTKAVVSEQCLGFSPEAGRCRQRQGYSVFETALIINDSIRSAGTEKEGNPWRSTRAPMERFWSKTRGESIPWRPRRVRGYQAGGAWMYLDKVKGGETGFQIASCYGGVPHRPRNWSEISPQSH